MEVKPKVVRIASAQYPIEFFESFENWQNKIEKWILDAVNEKAEVLVFPEYGAMELTSLLSDQDRLDLSGQSLKLKKYSQKFIDTFVQLARKNKLLIILPSFPYFHDDSLTTNRTFVVSPKGKIDFQDKFFMTRFENEDWRIQPGENTIKVFQTDKFNFSISTCFDIEFAFPAMAAAQAGAEIIFAPSCTETLKGANRVHIGARARGLENQLYIVVSQTIGEAKWSPAVDVNYGYAGFYCTPDVGFSDDGVIVTGEHNKPCWVIQDLRLSHLNKVRTSGAVFNFKTHQNIWKNSYFSENFPIKAQLIDFKD